MNKNTSGAVLVLILAAAGLAWAVPLAVMACVLVCVAAFLAEELRDASVLAELDGMDLKGIASVFAVISWIGVAFAFLALIYERMI